MRCDDFLEFQESLRKMRVMDDKIVYALNTTIPTESFKGYADAGGACKDLYEQLQTSYGSREGAIKQCITVVVGRVRLLKDSKAAHPDDIQINKDLKKEQTKLRLLQSELNVEEVVKERSLKVYYERCRSFFKPADYRL